jgi:hypothetical protein
MVDLSSGAMILKVRIVNIYAEARKIKKGDAAGCVSLS